MCVGPSMLPTFNTAGDVVILDRTSQWLRGEGGKQRTVRELCPPGSVVISRSPTNPQQTVCKRVIAVEGDAIWVPPTPWEELAAGADARRGRRVRIPPGQVWLEGDNPHNSTDSRQYGPVPVSLVKGRVFCKVWPLWELGVGQVAGGVECYHFIPGGVELRPPLHHLLGDNHDVRARRLREHAGVGALRERHA